MSSSYVYSAEDAYSNMPSPSSNPSRSVGNNENENRFHINERSSTLFTNKFTERLVRMSTVRMPNVNPNHGSQNFDSRELVENLEGEPELPNHEREDLIDYIKQTIKKEADLSDLKKEELEKLNDYLFQIPPDFEAAKIHMEAMKARVPINDEDDDLSENLEKLCI
jgi:hypothetical protein